MIDRTRSQSLMGEMQTVLPFLFRRNVQPIIMHLYVHVRCLPKQNYISMGMQSLLAFDPCCFQKDMHHGLMVASWQPSQVACRSALDVEAIGAEMARSIRRRRQAYVGLLSSRIEKFCDVRSDVS
jgi:hypothetical protein